jgi:hypothetical protein
MLYVRWVAVCSAGLSCIGALTAPGAAADTESVTDSTKDVMARHGARNGHDRNAAFADIVKLTSVHDQSRLIMKTRFVELISKPWQYLYLGVDVQTSEGRDFMGQITYGPDGDVHSISLLPEISMPKACYEKALESRVSHRTATIAFIIPTRCLGHPEWVRTGSTSYVVPNDYHVEWRDDARAPYRVPNSVGTYSEPTYGPEIPRG